jgi:phytoene dehydrogenase-like protein
VNAKVVLSNATPHVTYTQLINKESLPEEFLRDLALFDYTSPVTKINVAVSRLPNFLADPVSDNQPGPQHRGTIHLNCENSQLIHDAYLDAMMGNWSKKAVIEMTIPSSLDPTVAPPGAHVVQLFTQYTPFTLAGDKDWTEEDKNAYADQIFANIEDYAPGFKESVIGRDILTPPDLERIFGLTGGNIFHGAMSLDQLFFNRPLPAYCDYRSPISHLYNCGSSTHPGGGVMGSSGRLAAMTVLKDLKK